MLVEVIMKNYDYEIRKDFEYLFNDLSNGCTTDRDKLRLATELLKYSRDVLDSDLDNIDIFKEYVLLDKMCNDLDIIIQNYV